MFLLGLGVNENIIDEDDYECVEEVLGYSVH